jgi:hypothetical protein
LRIFMVVITTVNNHNSDTVTHTMEDEKEEV